MVGAATMYNLLPESLSADDAGEWPLISLEQPKVDRQCCFPLISDKPQRTNQITKSVPGRKVPNAKPSQDGEGLLPRFLSGPTRERDDPDPSIRQCLLYAERYMQHMAGYAATDAKSRIGVLF